MKSLRISVLIFFNVFLTLPAFPLEEMAQVHVRPLTHYINPRLRGLLRYEFILTHELTLDVKYRQRTSYFNTGFID